jgi:hypothetical protein
MLSVRINNYYTEIMLDPRKFGKHYEFPRHYTLSVQETEDLLQTFEFFYRNSKNFIQTMWKINLRIASVVEYRNFELL